LLRISVIRTSGIFANDPIESGMQKLPVLVL